MRRRAARAAPPPRGRRRPARGAAAGRAAARRRNASASSSTPFSLGQAPGVEHVDLAGEQSRPGAAPGSKRLEVDAPLPAADPLGRRSRARRSRSSLAGLGDSTHVAGAVEAAERGRGHRLQLRLARSAGRRRRPARCGSCRSPAARAPGPAARRRCPAGPGEHEVHEVIAALGQRLDDRRQPGHAERQPAVERAPRSRPPSSGAGRRRRRSRSPRRRSRARPGRGSAGSCG